jgi:hypothetical protein
MSYSQVYSFTNANITAQYGTSGGWITPSSNESFYLGRPSNSTKNYRCRLYFTTPANLYITGTARLVIGLRGNQKWTPKYMRAILSTKNASNSDLKHIVGSASKASDRLAISILYSDEAGTTRQTAAMSQEAGDDNNSKTTKECYLIFDYAF